MAQRLGNLAVGQSVFVNELGSPVEYLIVNQGLPSSIYDSSCNGTWLLRKYLYTAMAWGTTAVWESSTMQSWLNTTMLGFYDTSIQNVIKQVKIPYISGGVNGTLMTGSNGFSCKVFLLSGVEIGGTNTNIVPVTPDGVLLPYFVAGPSGDTKRIAYPNSGEDAKYWWTRSPSKTSNQVVDVKPDGDYNGLFAGRDYPYVRPAFVLSADLLVDDNNNVLADTYPVPPATITVPSDPVPSGSSIAVSWAAVSGATYNLQRSIDGGSWQTVYSGGSTSFTDTAGAWTQVKYRVASIKSSITSAYITSNIITILPYPITSFSVPSLVMENQDVPLSWSPVSAATTYVLERSANSGSFTQIYSGGNTSFTDTFQPGWTTLQYRVKAGANGSYGAYYTSGQIPVVSASALVISGTDSDLGTLTADVPYTVSSDTGNPITLQRKVNNNLVATLTVQSGFAYTIPVFDLPTGAGTIEIIASVNTTGGQVSATRTWQYSKASFLFPDSGGTAVLSQNSQNVLPGTIAEAVRTPAVWGGSLDKALELLLPIVKAAVISVGTYVGTGTYGESNPNTLTFNNNPVVVTIYGGGNTLAISSTDTSSSAYISGNTATWYANSAAAQMNSNGVTYSYVAVGKVV